MATRKGRKPTEQLDPKVVRKLLDLLSTDNEFRRLFKRDAYAALVKAGYRAPAGRTPEESASATGDDPVITKCIENQVRGWTFPPPGSETTINVPFVFLRQ